MAYLFATSFVKTFYRVCFTWSVVLYQMTKTDYFEIDTLQYNSYYFAGSHWNQIIIIECSTVGFRSWVIIHKQMVAYSFRNTLRWRHNGRDSVSNLLNR